MEQKNTELTETLFRSLVQAQFACIMIDGNSHILFYNQVAEQLWGYGSGQIIGQPITTLIPASDYTPQDSSTAINSAQSPSPLFSSNQRRKTVHRNGKTIWINLYPLTFNLENQQIKLFFVSDITEDSQLRELERDILQSLTSNLSFAEQGKYLCQRVHDIAPDIKPSILLADKERKLRPWAASHLPAKYNETIDGLPVSATLGSCGPAISHGMPVICADIAHDPLWKDFSELALSCELQACWSFPIKLRNGQAVGSFAFYSSTPRAPTAFHLRIIESCIHLCMLAIELEENRQRLDRLTNFDRLTGLPNSDQMAQYADKLLIQPVKQSIVFMSLGLDGFRVINEGLGHAAGDLVLLETAKRLKKQLTKNDFICRMESDRFGIISVGANAFTAQLLAGRLQNAITVPYDIDGVQLQLTASIGISIFPDGGTDRETLFSGTRKAMYEAKADAPGSIHFYSSEMTSQARERLLLGVELRRAISEGELQLAYQPQVHLTSGKIFGFEALARWHHPELGNISPDRFVKLAEEIGEIDALGRWALREGCQQLAAWRKEQVVIPSLSVNLSPHSFRDVGIVGYVASLLSEFHLSGKSLTIEITENAAMSLTDDMLEIVNGLRSLGVGLSIDDFGTGFSGLSNLMHLPVTELKIDRSFITQCVEDKRQKSLVDAMIGIGRSFNITVIAEGAETEAQRQFLQEHQCPVIQGYVFAKPMKPDDALLWLKNRTQQKTIISENPFAHS